MRIFNNSRAVKKRLKECILYPLFFKRETGNQAFTKPASCTTKAKVNSCIQQHSCGKIATGRIPQFTDRMRLHKDRLPGLPYVRSVQIGKSYDHPLKYEDILCRTNEMEFTDSMPLYAD